jgi:hypothetical protein
VALPAPAAPLTWFEAQAKVKGVGPLLVPAFDTRVMS